MTQALDWPTIYPTLTENQRRKIKDVLSPQEWGTLWYEQPSQVLPLDKNVLCICGRGWGKSTRLAKTLRAALQKEMHLKGDIIIVSPTPRHFERMFLPEIMQWFRPHERPKFNGRLAVLEYPHYGAEVKVFSGANPDDIKGGNNVLAILDEFAHYDYPSETFNETAFTLRTHDDARWIIGTTPKNASPESVHLLQRLRGMSGVHNVTGRTDENPFLSPKRVAEMVEECGGVGSAQYVEQFLGELVTSAVGALVTYEMIHENRVLAMPDEFDDMVVALDPAAEHGPESDETGIVLAGRLNKDAYIIADYSGRHSPDAVIRHLINAHLRYGITQVIVEENTGGMWLREMIKGNPMVADIPFYIIDKKATSKTGGKLQRIQPAAARYQQGRVHHVGHHADLETQWMNYIGLPSKRGEDIRLHDDRIDAAAYVINHLIGVPEPSITVF